MFITVIVSFIFSLNHFCFHFSAGWFSGICFGFDVVRMVMLLPRALDDGRAVELSLLPHGRGHAFVSRSIGECRHLVQKKKLQTQRFSTRGQFHPTFTSSFYELRSRKRKQTDGLIVFFALLGSSWVKAARKILVKSTGWCREVLGVPVNFRLSLFVNVYCLGFLRLSVKGWLRCQKTYFSIWEPRAPKGWKHCSLKYYFQSDWKTETLLMIKSFTQV